MYGWWLRTCRRWRQTCRRWQQICRRWQQICRKWLHSCTVWSEGAGRLACYLLWRWLLLSHILQAPQVHGNHCTLNTEGTQFRELSHNQRQVIYIYVYLFVCLFFPDPSPVKSSKVGREIVQSRKERQELSASASFQLVSIGQPSQSPLTGKPEKQNKARVNREPSRDRRPSWQGAWETRLLGVDHLPVPVTPVGSRCPLLVTAAPSYVDWLNFMPWTASVGEVLSVLRLDWNSENLGFGGQHGRYCREDQDGWVAQRLASWPWLDGTSDNLKKEVWLADLGGLRMGRLWWCKG